MCTLLTSGESAQLQQLPIAFVYKMMVIDYTFIMTGYCKTILLIWTFGILFSGV